MYRTLIALFICLGVPVSVSAVEPVAEVLHRWDVPEAHQAVAVDKQHFYAISNSRIGKYDKKSGERVALWEASEEIPLTHLNAGIIYEGKLYCSSSNYPVFPEASSVEIFDPKTLTHIDSHSFGIYEGSLTWVDQRNQDWWAVFAHYSRKRDDDPFSKPHTFTAIVKFDQQWRRTGGYTFPSSVLERFDPNSCSGGSWGPNGNLFCTGHDHGELYELALPKGGPTLSLIRTIKVEITGQGIAWDQSAPGILYGINRSKRQVIVSRIPFEE